VLPHVEDPVLGTAADTGLERALLNQVHLSPRDLGEVPLEPEESEDPRRPGELDRDIHIASLVLDAFAGTSRRCEDPT